MKIYFKQDLIDKRNFAVVDNAAEATHYQEDNGNITSISELTINPGHSEGKEEGGLQSPVLDFTDGKKTKPVKTNSNRIFSIGYDGGLTTYRYIQKIIGEIFAFFR